MFTGRQPREFLDTKILARLAGMPLFARRAMQGNVSGKHTSPHRGASVEFAEYRKYVPGDDLRRLDWRAYGRSDRFYIKEFEADTNLRCCVVLDTSGSMDFGTTGTTKIQYARQIAASLGYLAVQQGDAIGLHCFADGIVKNVPAKRNAAHLSLIFDTLEQAIPEGPTQLISVLHELAETIRQRALIVVISDFFVDPAELRGCFEHLRFRKHDLAAFQLLDPAELEFTFQRPTRFLDMEGGPAIFAEPNVIADRYQTALNEYLKQLQQIVLETGVDYHRTRIDEPFEQALMRFLVGRTRGRGVR
ncbi:hypothetical protein FF011L_52480 [Roseimaritima multifibrata]|uniref:DUF58 domain-containing protein n=1 Tax=Roseimaritima multifibrata TaxID=1930274 RepID=A0A517MNS8_9BACT|nr:DUF58 domain-containing protein [Roseimaritima multifibrata]QDS96437.1 hypothetical protein FF011L_52480 [Roseimaritima multifibrata]